MEPGQAKRESAIVTNKKGTNIRGVRNYNERLILQLIRRNGSLTKAETSRATGLSANAVSVIFRSLEHDKLVLKGNPIRGRLGQPSIPMRLNPDAACYLGLKIGRRSIEMVAMDYAGNTLGHAYRTHRYPMPDEAVEFAREATRDVLKQSGLPRKAVSAMGVAMPYELWSWTSEFDAPQAEMEAWKSADLRSALGKIGKWPIFIENDGTAACGAELTFGHNQSKQEFIYFFVGTLIGGGIVLNGSVFTGRSGNAGGFGPMPVPGRRGRSERLVDQASLFVLERMIADAGGDPLGIYVGEQTWHVHAKEVNQWINLTARGLAHAIVATLSIIDLESVIIDGAFPDSVREALTCRTGIETDKLDLQGIRRPDITVGSFGSKARAVGAACLPLLKDHSINHNTFLQDQ